MQIKSIRNEGKNWLISFDDKGFKLSRHSSLLGSEPPLTLDELVINALCVANVGMMDAIGEARAIDMGDVYEVLWDDWEAIERAAGYEEPS